MECVSCGYELEGLSGPLSIVVCPECGKRQAVDAWAPRPLGSRWRVAWRLCSGTVVACGVCALVTPLTAIPSILPATLSVLALASVSAFLTGIIWPAVVAERLAIEARPRGVRRRRFERRLLVVGLAINLALGIGFIFVGVGMLELLHGSP